jgi:hypothetical protein
VRTFKVISFNYFETHKTLFIVTMLCNRESELTGSKIRNKGKIVSAGYQGVGGEREGEEWVVREEVGAGGRNDPSIVCTYE